MPALLNKTAIVTGASSGIGHAAARLFAAEGAAVVAAARRAGPLADLVRGIEANGGRALACAGDVRDEAFVASLTEAAVGAFGALDIAFNNAGILGALGPIPDMAAEEWHLTLDTNLTAAFLAAKHQVPALLAGGGGSMVFTGTFVGHTAGMPGMGAYAASKAGLIGLVQVLAAEYGPLGLRVNALLPGGVDTPMGQSVTTDDATTAFVNNLHALKRVAAPDEIANAALLLASDAASFVTGSAMRADGGVSVTRT